MVIFKKYKLNENVAAGMGTFFNNANSNNMSNNEEDMMTKANRYKEIRDKIKNKKPFIIREIQ